MISFKSEETTRKSIRLECDKKICSKCECGRDEGRAHASKEFWFSENKTVISVFFILPLTIVIIAIDSNHMRISKWKSSF